MRAVDVVVKLDDQWMTLISVGFGGAVGYLGTTLTDQRHRREQRRTRWDEVRARAYFEYGAAVKTEIRTCDRMAKTLGFRDGAPPMSLAEGLPRLAGEQDRRTVLLEQILLIGSDATAAAAREWQALADSMRNALEDAETDAALAKQNYLSAFADANAARSRFYEVARQELDIVR